jgi:heme exporter protein CcmD
MSEFFSMSGYGAYVWSAYGIAMAAFFLNIWIARRDLAKAREQVRRRLASQETP